jgi:hypothetical protein
VDFLKGPAGAREPIIPVQVTVQILEGVNPTLLSFV